MVTDRVQKPLYHGAIFARLTPARRSFLPATDR